MRQFSSLSANQEAASSLKKFLKKVHGDLNHAFLLCLYFMCIINCYRIILADHLPIFLPLLHLPLFQGPMDMTMATGVETPINGHGKTTTLTLRMKLGGCAHWVLLEVIRYCYNWCF